jgi:RNA polymerase sigma-70 factor (ECF subfamily)
VRTGRRTTPLVSEHLAVADAGADPEATTAGRLGLEALREALLQVPEHERAALLMATVDGLTHDQVAAALNCSRAAVKVRIHRARLRLRDLMTAKGPTP